MANTNTADSDDEPAASVTLGSGGFSTDTELITPTGPRAVVTLDPGDEVYALNPTTELLKPKPLAAVKTVVPTEPIVELTTRRAAFRVGTGHPLYYRTAALPRPRVTLARDIPGQTHYKFLTDWTNPRGEQLATIDITDLTDQYEARVEYDCHGSTFRAALPDGCEPCRGNSHTGYYFDSTTFKQYQTALETRGTSVAVCGGSNSWGRPYRFAGDDFLEFVGWFITEGSVTHKPDRDSTQINFAQQDPEGRARLRELFDRMGLEVAVSEDLFSFGSTVYANLLERLCGATSKQRRLPWFTWTLSAGQKRLLLDTLLAGDGNDYGIYYTASDDLAGDVLRLVAELGRKPQYDYRRGTWRISTADVRDGFRSDRNAHWIPPTGPLVRLTVTDYPAVLAGRNGQFQWIGVSGVA